MTANGTPIVQALGVSRAYRLGRVQTMALRNVTLDIPGQCFVILTGQSGSGKSTLLNLVGCVDVPTSGDLVVCGKNVVGLQDDELAEFRADSIGYVFQNFGLFPVLTAFENVEYPLLLGKQTATKRPERVRAMLAAVGLEDKADHLPKQLSGGEQQRVAIARALVKTPPLVLADEPTANLDSKTGRGIVELMKRIQHQFGVSFVLSTHDPRLRQYADHHITLLDGSVICPKMEVKA